jgi:hypothetical protein
MTDMERIADAVQACGYTCRIDWENDLVIVDDPVHTSGRIVTHKPVVLRSIGQAARFLDARS